MKQQGKWSSPGGNSKQFKSSVNNLTITWYSKKQLTLAFQGRAGPVLKGILTKLVRDNAGRTDSTGSNVSSTVEQVNPLLFEANDIYANQPRVAEAGPVFSSQERSNTELVADLEGTKLDLLILQKKVEANSNLLSINCHNREEFAVSAELCEYKGRCEKLESSICKKERVIEELEEKCLSLENRAVPLEQENDSLRLALRLILQEKNEEDSHHQQETNECFYQVKNSGTNVGCNKRNQRKMSTQNNIVTRNRFEILSDAQDDPTETEAPTHKIIRRRQNHQRASYRSSRSNPSEPSETSANDDLRGEVGSERSASSKFTTLLIGDSMVKDIHGKKLAKAVGHRVVVKSFSGATAKAMRDYLKPNLELQPDEVVLHVGTNDLKAKNGKTSKEVAEAIVDLAKQIEGSSEAQVIVSGLVTRKDKLNDKVSEVNNHLTKFCRQNDWRFIEHNNINEKGLNRGGVHLNFAGNKRIFKNFYHGLAH